MGRFSSLFKGEDDEGRKVSQREKNDDRAIHQFDRITPTDDKGGHVHESARHDTAGGGYKEHIGGENSSDRSNNKK